MSAPRRGGRAAAGLSTEVWSVHRAEPTTCSYNCKGENCLMKMICRILLLLNLASCVEATLVVNVTQSSYQAEENHNITLEWTFTTSSDSSTTSLFIFCQHVTDHSISALFHLHGGVEVPESQNKQFAGRVQWDKDVLREGRVRLHVSRLRTEDSGMYVCKLRTNDDDLKAGRCWLHVTAARDWPRPEKPSTDEPERQSTASRGRTGLYCGLGLTAAAAATVLVACYLRSFTLCHLEVDRKLLSRDFGHGV